MARRAVVTVHGHRLANSRGRLRRARFVLYSKLSGIAGNCYWCEEKLTWNKVCADHLDSNTLNDAPENLVASCRACNANRDDGTGNGRRKPKKCPVCSTEFIASSHHERAIFCSNKCASARRPKRGIHSKHGTRSQYVAGCRCDPCKKINSAYWRERYGKASRVGVGKKIPASAGFS